MNKSDSKRLQGLAILLMFMHHLFGSGTFLVPDQSLWHESQLAIMIGGAAKVCVAIFVVTSGYALYESYIRPEKKKKSLLKRWVSFLMQYWVIMFFVAIPYLIIAGKMVWGTLPINLFALLHNDEILYVSFSWYVKLYVMFLLLIPVFRRIQFKPGLLSFIVEFLIFIVLPLYLYSISAPLFNRKEFLSAGNFIGSTFVLIIGYLPLFYEGVMLAKYRIFKILLEKAERVNRFILLILSMIAIAGVFYFRFQWAPDEGRMVDLWYAPILILAFLLLLKSLHFKPLNWLFNFLGTYSFQYWLLSGMFFLNTVELQWILFIPRRWYLIVLWSFIILTPLAVLTNKLALWISNTLISFFDANTKKA